MTQRVLLVVLLLTGRRASVDHARHVEGGGQSGWPRTRPQSVGRSWTFRQVSVVANCKGPADFLHAVPTRKVLGYKERHFKHVSMTVSGAIISH